MTDDGFIALLTPLSFASGGGLGLEEISVKNSSRLCAPDARGRLLNTVAALAGQTTGARAPPPWSPRGRTTARQGRHLTLALKSSSRCRDAVNDPAWMNAAMQWRGGWGEVKVSVGRRA